MQSNFLCCLIGCGCYTHSTTQLLQSLATHPVILVESCKDVAFTSWLIPITANDFVKHRVYELLLIAANLIFSIGYKLNEMSSSLALPARHAGTASNDAYYYNVIYYCHFTNNNHLSGTHQKPFLTEWQWRNRKYYVQDDIVTQVLLHIHTNTYITIRTYQYVHTKCTY